MIQFLVNDSPELDLRNVKLLKVVFSRETAMFLNEAVDWIETKGSEAEMEETKVSADATEDK